MPEYNGYNIKCEPGGSVSGVKAVVREGRHYIGHVVAPNSARALEKAQAFVDQLVGAPSDADVDPGDGSWIEDANDVWRTVRHLRRQAERADLIPQEIAAKLRKPVDVVAYLWDEDMDVDELDEWTLKAAAELASAEAARIDGGVILRRVRTMARLSQGELAERCGVSSDHLSKVERGVKPCGGDVVAAVWPHVRIVFVSSARGRLADLWLCLVSGRGSTLSAFDKLDVLLRRATSYQKGAAARPYVRE